MAMHLFWGWIDHFCWPFLYMGLVQYRGKGQDMCKYIVRCMFARLPLGHDSCPHDYTNWESAIALIEGFLQTQEEKQLLNPKLTSAVDRGFNFGSP